MARLPEELAQIKFTLKIKLSPSCKQNEAIEISPMNNSGQRNLE